MRWFFWLIALLHWVQWKLIVHQHTRLTNAFTVSNMKPYEWFSKAEWLSYHGDRAYLGFRESQIKALDLWNEYESLRGMAALQERKVTDAWIAERVVIYGAQDAKDRLTETEKDAN